MLVAMKAKDVVVFTDSQLVAQQLLGNFEVKEDFMFQYISRIRKETARLTSFHIEQIDREKNKEADELARLANSLSAVPEGKATIFKAGVKSIEEEVILTIVEGGDWRKDIIRYLQMGDGSNGTLKVARKYTGYFLQDGHLYIRGFNNPHLKFLASEEGKYLLQEIHSGCCGAHSEAKDLVRKAIRAGFYWAKMEVEAKKIVKICGQCQKYGKITHVPGVEIGSILVAYPFDKWRIDIVRKLATALGG